MFGLQRLAPNNNVDTFANWWHNTSRRVAKENRKGVNTLIILGAWSLWKHRNSGVFEGTAPSVQSLLDNLKHEAQLWTFAGARGLKELGLGRLLGHS
ncbi:hypothetical protein PR202_gb07894 [Eleusine coracana subsp. coracana]|uniref:Uncharacterized protein n=1 Tax=Eleusine coracana subsp. coracana TaxID=191504 RepID=A0AAV5ECK4_ELECO|nr:hypothetical protein PR202_gb07894 [Eleusine coracana subsp. coracana]